MPYRVIDAQPHSPPRFLLMGHRRRHRRAWLVNWAVGLFRMLVVVAVPWVIYVIFTDEYLKAAPGCYEDPNGPWCDFPASFLRYLFGFPVDRFLFIALGSPLAAFALGAALVWAVRGFKRF
jgi:hypothetical protein